jgi:hypothetical protein
MPTPSFDRRQDVPDFLARDYVPLACAVAVADRCQRALYHVLGIDPETTMIHDLEGRPMHLLDDRKPVKELL